MPPFVEGRDRSLHFEPDGTLVYDHQEATETAWEPPRPIDGFAADPKDPWRLRPLWGRCGARMHTAIRFTVCGCLGLVTRCTEPRARFLERVSYEVCQKCPFENRGPVDSPGPSDNEESDHAL